MKPQDACQNLLDNLRSAAGLLDPDRQGLRRDILALCDRLASPDFRIAVFGPFNYGKSTLLNAMLGERALPIDLIPTTGAAIRVRYGNELQTRITLASGTEISETGTEVLKQFAILDDDRRMRDDVTAVEVFCPHPFLQLGVELLDLPGTNDREAQDELVRDWLLTADLVVQVLDGRKLMTLGERENLRDWLLDRGIKTVVFVVNFLNLLEPQDQKEVSHRLRFVAESFRSQLPPGVSNLYRVDALPALRARLKGDIAAAQRAGLPMFESALQTIVQVQRVRDTRLPRIVAIAVPVQQALQAKIQAIATDVEMANQNRSQKTQIKQKAQKLIQQGFTTSVATLRDWLTLPNLLDRYQAEATSALQRFEFKTWETDALKPDWIAQQRVVVDWVYKACEFFNQARPADLWVAFPDEPAVLLPDQPAPPTKQSGDVTPVAIATGLGFIMGGPLGAAVLGGASYLLQTETQGKPPSATGVNQNQAYANAARDYLSRFSTAAIAALQQYEAIAEKVISFQITEEPSQATSQQHQLRLLQTTLNNLNQALEPVSGSL